MVTLYTARIDLICEKNPKDLSIVHVHTSSCIQSSVFHDSLCAFYI